MRTIQRRCRQKTPQLWIKTLLLFESILFFLPKEAFILKSAVIHVRNIFRCLKIVGKLRNRQKLMIPPKKAPIKWQTLMDTN